MSCNKSTLCWDCANAYKKCPWSKDFKPVPGWDAEPTKIKYFGNTFIDSFIVHSCPLYKDEDNLIPVDIAYISKILNLKRCEVRKLKKNESLKRCAAAGKNVVMKTINGSRYYYLIKERKSYYIPSELANLFKIHVKNTQF